MGAIGLVAERPGGDGLARDFDEFYRSEFASMVVLAVAVTGRRIGAEDVAQEAMLDAHRRWDRIATYDSPRAWVRKVVVQRAVKTSRKQANERTAASGRALAVVGSPEPTGLDPQLRDALLELPPQQRAVMALHYLEDLSVADTAEVLGVTEGTVKTQLSRGRSRLAGLLGVAEGSVDDG
jgi:RNA polymerase sigma-70 factor (ECF subfamily)